MRMGTAVELQSLHSKSSKQHWPAESLDSYNPSLSFELSAFTSFPILLHLCQSEGCVRGGCGVTVDNPAFRPDLWPDYDQTPFWNRVTSLTVSVTVVKCNVIAVCNSQKAMPLTETMQTHRTGRDVLCWAWTSCSVCSCSGDLWACIPTCAGKDNWNGWSFYLWRN